VYLMDSAELRSRPLVILFGSYRGRGTTKLAEITALLRSRRINAYTVEEHRKLIPHKTELDNSLECVDECDIAVFVFFRGDTIGVEDHLEGLDQGPVIEFAYLCLCKKRETAVQLVFDTKERFRYSSSLLHKLLEKSPYVTWPGYPDIEGDSPKTRLESITAEVLAFCVNEYKERGTW